MLHVEGGEIVRFFSCGGVGYVEGGKIVRFFRVVRGGRNGRTVRANHISRRETSGTYEDEDSIRLIGRGFPANTFTTERALYQYFSIILQKILNELLICTE